MQNSFYDLNKKDRDSFLLYKNSNFFMFDLFNNIINSIRCKTLCYNTTLRFRVFLNNFLTVTSPVSKRLVESLWQYAKNVELTMESLILLSILGSPFLPLPEGWLTRRSSRHTYLTIPTGPKREPEGALFLHSECSPTLHSFFSFPGKGDWPSISPQM